MKCATGMLNYCFPFYRPWYSHLLSLCWIVYVASFCTLRFLLEDSFLNLPFSLVRFDNLLKFSDQILQIFNCSVINLRHWNKWKNKMFFFFSVIYYMFSLISYLRTALKLFTVYKSPDTPTQALLYSLFYSPILTFSYGAGGKLFMVYCFKRNLEMKYLFILKISKCLATPVEIPCYKVGHLRVAHSCL